MPHILLKTSGTIFVTGTATPNDENPFADTVTDQVPPVETMA